MRTNTRKQKTKAYAKKKTEIPNEQCPIAYRCCTASIQNLWLYEQIERWKRFSYARWCLDDEIEPHRSRITVTLVTELEPFLLIRRRSARCLVPVRWPVRLKLDCNCTLHTRTLHDWKGRSDRVVCRCAEYKSQHQRQWKTICPLIILLSWRTLSAATFVQWIGVVEYLDGFVWLCVVVCICPGNLLFMEQICKIE